MQIKTIIISVGGSPDPVIYSLNDQKPEYICYYVSSQSRDNVALKIRPELTFRYREEYFIQTTDAEDMEASFKVLHDEIPEIIRKWGIEPESIIVDYTAGTKVMSAALCLAAIHTSSHFSYVGGKERSKEGLGIVQSGSERMVYHYNPWDLLAVEQRRKASLLFNSAQYRTAVAVIEEIEHKVSSNLKRFFSSLKLIIEGYELWDRFQHDKAIQKINKGLPVFGGYCAGCNEESYHTLALKVEQNFEFLKMTTQKSRSHEWLPHDLIANSMRRAFREHKYDDATARLYRAIEAYSGTILKEKYGIDTSSLHPEKVPESIKDEYIKKYLDEEKGVLQIGLYASYRLLDALGDDVGSRFIAVYEKSLKKLLNDRNSSILAHGNVPIKDEKYDELLRSTMEFTGITDAELPAFPELTL